MSETGDVSGRVGAARRDVALASAAQRELDDWLAELAAGDRLDPSARSRLPDWSVGHVLAHLRFNAESHTRMFLAAARGEVGEQYPGGRRRREREIEQHAALTAVEHVTGVRTSSAALEAAWRQSTWVGSGRRADGPVPLVELPFLRLREVLLHRIDLGLGFELVDLPDAYVRLELRRLEMVWTARRPMGLTALPPAALQRPPHERLGWLAGRLTIDGLPPADLF
jgi:maleylpyruvate isomerase